MNTSEKHRCSADLLDVESVVSGPQGVVLVVSEKLVNLGSRRDLSSLARGISEATGLKVVILEVPKSVSVLPVQGELDSRTFYHWSLHHLPLARVVADGSEIRDVIWCCTKSGLVCALDGFCLPFVVKYDLVTVQIESSLAADA